MIRFQVKQEARVAERWVVVDKVDISDKGDKSSGNSSSDQSLTAISNKGKCTTDKDNKTLFLSNTISEALSCIYYIFPSTMIRFQVKQEARVAERWVVVDKVDIADTVDTKRVYWIA
jgi:hypothetical protein